MLTYRNIKAIINQFAKSHAQIRNWQKGNPYDVDEVQQVDGAQLVWNCNGITPDKNVGASWSYTLFFMSQITEVNNASNADDVINESILQAMDFLSFLHRYGVKGFKSVDQEEDVEFNKSWSIDPFEERFNSLYAGAMLTFNISGTFDYNRCQIPIEVVSDGIITQSGITLITQSGEVIILN